MSGDKARDQGGGVVNPTKASNYLVVVNDIPHISGGSDARAIIEFLTAQGVWVFPDYASHLKAIAPGDRLIIYLAGRRNKIFFGVATVTSRPEPVNERLKHELEKRGLGWFTFSVHISKVKTLHPPIPIDAIVNRLTFVKDKKNYGLSLRQGVRRIESKDANVILSRRIKQ